MIKSAAFESFYIGPDKPRLALSSVNDVNLAAGAGLLDESAWVELKRDIPQASRPANKELAKDLASLSVDGGILLVGVDDDAHVVGFTGDPANLRTRLIQVAGAGVTPPLFVDIDMLTSDSDPGVTVAVVRVPASGSAPHMVDGSYWGRTAEGKRALPDGEVERLIVGRRMRADLVAADLDQVESDLGPLSRPVPMNSHLAFIARPHGAPHLAVTDIVGSNEVAQVLAGAIDFQPSFSPWGHLLPHVSFRPDAIALSDHDPRWGDRHTEESGAYRILLRDDGSVVALAGGASRSYSHHRLETEMDLIVCGYLLEGVHVLTRLAAHLGSAHLAYGGDWQVGVLITDLAGRHPSDWLTSGAIDAFAYPTSQYSRLTASTTREMLEQPAEVVHRLLHPMLRSLGVARNWLPYQDGGDIGGRAQRR